MEGRGGRGGDEIWGDGIAGFEAAEFDGFWFWVIIKFGEAAAVEASMLLGFGGCRGFWDGDETFSAMVL